ncbi:general stress protein [Pseudarthrobacter sp. PS3-L1]|uniref:general stress protein n=1 Tax=Pseudarthrobacter sp. PS3-L1 TaxID=3046207 RepID=UPI0024BB7F04|nr:general stress protein [Pseudarthrobacter sp. PS3-L1]MDJ0321419.1 ECF transporter S component [Pseudarthrobacter sp. PS3-L1]
MSNIFGAPKTGGQAGRNDPRMVPTGDTIGSYTSYLDAQKAVDYLADQQFPVQLVSIVGNDLKMVEHVTGRLTYPRVALSGALSGVWFGLFVGVLLSFFSTSPGYFSILTSVLMGAAFFMLFGIVTYAMQRGKRDFTSTSQVVATTYNVIVAPEAAHDARRLLQQLPMTPSDANRAPAYTQQNQGYQQPGQSPERPASWNDPYGQHQGQVQGPQAPAGEQGAPGQQDGQSAGSPEPAHQPRPAGVRYPDLPDGRPQYGVRVEAPDASPGQGSAAKSAESEYGDGSATGHSAGHQGEGKAGNGQHQESTDPGNRH